MLKPIINASLFGEKAKVEYPFKFYPNKLIKPIKRLADIVLLADKLFPIYF